MSSENDEELRLKAKLFAVEHLGGTDNPNHQKLVTELTILLREVQKHEWDLMRNHLRRREGSL